MTPSAVLVEDDGAVVGRDAIKAAQIMPNQVARDLKREMGNDPWSRSFGGTNYPPLLIQSLLLARLRCDAEAELGRAVPQAVIAVPACFDEPKRRATIDAALLAGLKVKSIVNEPTAAAIAVAWDRARHQTGDLTSLMYDLGGGMFDTSIVRFQENAIRVMATGGNAMLGGLDWDKCIARWLDAEFSLQQNVRPSESTAGDAFLLRESEEIKHALSSRKRAGVRLAWEGRVLKTEIARERFDEFTAHLLDRTRFIVRRLLNDTGLTWAGIDTIMLGGGSTRMPQVAQMLHRESGIEPDSSAVTGESVAQGAAIYAAMLNSRADNTPEVLHQTNLSVTDVNAHSLGVLGADKQTSSRCNHIMIPRNTALPAAHTTCYETIRDGQRSVAFEIIEGGDARGKHSTRIGRCVIDKLPPGLPAGTPVDVEIRYNTDTIVEVKASLRATGHHAHVRLERASAMTGEMWSNLRELFFSLDPNSQGECSAD